MDQDQQRDAAEERYVGDLMRAVVNQVLTWGQVKAMERSHAWTQFRIIGSAARRCASCGDAEESEVRYCPGVKEERSREDSERRESS